MAIETGRAGGTSIRIRASVSGADEAGVASAPVGLRNPIVAGGALCVVSSVAIAAMLPRLWAHDARHAPPQPDLIQAM